MNNLTKSVMVASLLSSSVVFAGADYPAADFQPKVLYSSEAATASAASSAPAPASSSSSESDANYPATNYQPKVLFSDSSYQHSSAAPGTPQVSKASGSVASASVSEQAVAAEKSDSNNNLIGLVALAAIGFFLYSKKNAKGGAAGPSANVTERPVVAGESTGVEKYLEKQGLNKTGVEKYLEKQTANPATGVAKYMAKQIIKDREAAAAKVTGVEKYLRDNG